MSAWRREALLALPELRGKIEGAYSPMSLWIDLYSAFEDAFKSGNVKLIDRMIRFALWCLSEESGKLPNDTSTAVVCAFFEDLPVKREHWPIIAKKIPIGVFGTLRPHFRYHLDMEQAEELEAYYCAEHGIRPTRLKRKQ